MTDARQPVLVGVGQVTNRRARLVDPMTLMEESARAADADAGGGILPYVRSVRVPNVLSWSYPAPASSLADRLGLSDGERLYTTVGGSTPQWIVADACDAIARGEVDCVLVAGAEALDSARRARAQGLKLDRGERGGAVVDRVVGDDRSAMSEAEQAARVVLPTVVYALFESALAAEAGRSFEEQRLWLGPRMARFSEVAATHPDEAWFPDPLGGDDIATIGARNRFVCEPYPKLVNAVLQVDQGAAVILASASTARAAGVPRDRWVFPWAATEADDVFLTAARPQLTWSPALEAAWRRVLEAAGVGADDLRWLDLYSCFPSAVQVGAAALGTDLDDPRGLTVTGGLPYFGGPGSNYVTHALVALARRLREEPESIGAVSGVSWYLTKHAVGLYSAAPPKAGWRHPDGSADRDRIEAAAVPVAVEAEGPATVEAMTVEHLREQGPVSAPVFARLADGRRVVAAAADPKLPAELSGRSLVGEKVRVRAKDGGCVYAPD